MEQPKVEPSEVRAVTASDIDSAHAEAQRAKAILDCANGRLESIADRHGRLARRLKRYELTKRARSFFDTWTTRNGGLFLAILGPCLAALVVSHALGLPFFLRAAFLFAVFATSAIAGTQLFAPGDAQLASKTESLRSDVVSLLHQRAQAEAEASQAKNIFNQRLLEYHDYVRQFHSRINRLRSTDWKSSQAVPFENFLADVFLEWGYEVQPIKANEDNGVDLIVCKNGQKTAIQANGYRNSIVELDAVQQVYTGKAIYGCDRCALITASTFAPSARRAAEAVNCSLIDGEQIPLLIEGKLPI